MIRPPGSKGYAGGRRTLKGRLKYCYNFFGIQHFFAEATQPIPAGEHQVCMEFAYDGGGLAKGGTVTLFVMAPRSARAAWTRPRQWASQPTRPLRSDPTWARRRHPTTARKTTPSTVTSPGWVQIDIGDDDHDHLITPEERFKLAIARQEARRQRLEPSTARSIG